MGTMPAHGATTVRAYRPRSPQRRAMVLLGSVVLGASLLGTLVGHLLSPM